MDAACDKVKVSWSGLLWGIREAFGSDKVDVDGVKALLSSYQAKREDWEPYAKFDPHKYVKLAATEDHCILSLVLGTQGTW